MKTTLPEALVASPLPPATPQEGEPYLEISGLWKAFGDFLALRDVSLTIHKGEFVCFLGPSGCGKTTLLRAIAGLDPQSRGTIRQGGRDISTLPPSRRDYGIVFQSYALFPNLSIRRNIAFGLENSGRPRGEIAARVDELLALVGLPEQGDKYPAQLSGGQQQRIALARAMAVDPGLLLLDEPLSALDAKVRVHLRHEIKALQRKLGVTTIMVTHDQEEALAMADRIVVMNHGVIEQVGRPTEVYREPASLFVADFIGEANQIPALYGRGKVSFAGLTLATGTRPFREAEPVTVVIRPEDIQPHEPGRAAANTAAMTVRAMEFLGTWWRCHLLPVPAAPATAHTRAMGIGEMIAAGLSPGTAAPEADFPPLAVNISVGAARRLGLEPGAALTIEIPPERVLVFPRSA